MEQLTTPMRRLRADATDPTPLLEALDIIDGNLTRLRDTLASYAERDTAERNELDRYRDAIAGAGRLLALLTAAAPR